MKLVTVFVTISDSEAINFAFVKRIVIAGGDDKHEQVNMVLTMSDDSELDIPFDNVKEAQVALTRITNDVNRR